MFVNYLEHLNVNKLFLIFQETFKYLFLKTPMRFLITI